MIILKAVTSEVKMMKRAKMNYALTQMIGIIIYWNILCAYITGVKGVPDGKQPHKRFEYKYSFKPPYLAQKDGTVPFFEYSGSKYD